jgi:very-short-patch-repair endonuclease
MKEKEIIRNTLVAILKYRSDLEIALNKGWYRIPLKTKRTPLSVKENKLEYIAFYQTSVFGEDAFRIYWFAKTKNISVVKRKELFPVERKNPKSEEAYYKIEFEKCSQLKKPIISKRHRRMLFVNTTYDRLISSSEFNDLFIESPIEENLWEKLKAERIEAERQFMLQTKNQLYYLDFALFCKERNLDVECDGDEYHLSVDAVKYDKIRNNDLTKLGWIVLRYHTDQIKKNMNNVIGEVKETINRYGGLELASNPNDFKYYSTDDQIQLFE